MTCDECGYFKILYEPIHTKGVVWDLGRAMCEKHNYITDYANHSKFKKLDTCEDFKGKVRDKE